MLWDLEWLNLNSQRAYPLVDSANGVDNSESFALPNSFIVALDIPVSAGVSVDPSRFFVLNIGSFASGFSITIGYQPATGSPVSVAQSLVARLGFIPNTTYALVGLGDFADTVGKITIGYIDDITLQPAGQFTFSLVATAITPDCVRPVLRGISAFLVNTGASTSVPLYGDVTFVAGTNCAITTTTDTDGNPVIQFDAVNGAGLNQDCTCIGTSATGGPIKTINAVPPNSSGNFQLNSTASCMVITAAANAVNLADTCAQPCCGCTELTVIAQDLKTITTNAAVLSGQIATMQAWIAAATNTLLASRISDIPCP